jgi:flagellar biogenesis protein FliO
MRYISQSVKDFGGCLLAIILVFFLIWVLTACVSPQGTNKKHYPKHQ